MTMRLRTAGFQAVNPPMADLHGATADSALFRLDCSGFDGLSIYETPAVSPADGGDFNMSVKNGDAQRAAANVRVLEQLIGMPVAGTSQVHSADVVDLDSALAGAPVGDYSAISERLRRVRKVPADALISTRRDVALGIFTADCTPVAFADMKHGIFATAHAGRLGVVKNIAAATIHAMVAKGATTQDIRVWLGANICGDCYETGDEIADAFEKQFPGCSTTTRFGGRGIDMRPAVRSQLRAAGIPDANVRASGMHAGSRLIGYIESQQAPLWPADGGRKDAPVGAAAANNMCTFENPLLYSYRQSTVESNARANGRFLTVLVPPARS